MKKKVRLSYAVFLLCSPDTKKYYSSQFWMFFENKYSFLTDKAIILLMVFPTSCLCEKSFSSLALVITKQRNRLDADLELGVSETTLMSRLPRITGSETAANFPLTLIFLCK